MQRHEEAHEFAARCSGAHSRLSCIALGITGNREDADDIVQQAITIAIEKNRAFESDAHFVGWLAGIVRNCALNHRRKSTRRRTRPTDPANLHSVENKPESDNPVNRQTGQLRPLQGAFDDRMQTALQQLSAKARSCLLLRTVEGLGYREISDLMGISEGTAMNLVHRSKKSLRKILASDPNRDIATDGQSGDAGGHHGSK